MLGEGTDTIFLRDLEVHCIIGVNDWERMVKQPVQISYDIPCDVREPAREDDIEKAVDYKSVSKWIIDFVEDSEFELLETLTERIAEGVITELGVPRVRLSVEKPGAIRHSRTVGIQIERSKDDF